MLILHGFVFDHLHLLADLTATRIEQASRTVDTLLDLVKLRYLIGLHGFFELPQIFLELLHLEVVSIINDE